MTELFNSLKAFASSSSGSLSSTAAVATTASIGNRNQFSHFHQQPLMTLGRADSCTESGFNQWRDAMRMVARLPGGLPPEFRIRLWENLADRYLQAHHIDWSRIASKCLSSSGSGNSRDQEISDQIEKDLHRTGCTGFSGGAKQAVLKQVLVSYSRWNPAVGYCQGFNMIGAMLLQMTNGNEKLTLKIFIFLIEGVLPEGYFGQGLRGLAVEMAVFREILKFRKPTLNAHLTRLQKKDNSPPLTDVFTMHWFLTLFIHCLPPQTVLRVWDLILLEGSEIILRTSLVLWAAIETRILGVKNTDEFYSVMGVVTREMLEFGLMEPNALMKCVVSVGPFPFPGLEELRQRQRAIISKDAPCKSFFLAKRELDTLKRHYAAMRHKQRTTTVIFRNPDPHPKGQNSGRLLVVPTKKQVISPKPKVRRQGSGKSINAASPLISTNKSMSPATHAHAHTKNPPNNGSIIHLHSISHVHSNSNNRSKQVTVSWDKSLKNKFRRRRSSASSHTSTSSSTELCDSSSSDENEEGSGSTSNFSQPIWMDPPNPAPAPVSKLGSKNNEDKTESNESSLPENVQSLKTLTANTASIEVEPSPVHHLAPAIVTDDSKDEGLSLDLELGPPLTIIASDDHDLENVNTNAESPPPSAKCIDTNDSQHFLDEMSKLGKSDSFYENLSQRICELQFQNITLLTTCNTAPTTTDKENSHSLIVENEFVMSSSPLPSPISPIQSFYEQDFSKLSPSPNCMQLSPRGSISSNGESPLPRSPLSPSPDPNFSNLLPGAAVSRKNSKSSVSSFEVPNDEKTDKTRQPETAHTPELCAEPNSGFVVQAPSPSPLTSSSRTLPKFVLPIPTINGKFSSEEEVEVDRGASPYMTKSAGAWQDLKDNFAFSPEPLGVEVDTSSGLLDATPTATNDLQLVSESKTSSEDDINTVIRENIAILQRLKMKPAYGDDTGDDFDYFAYYSTDSSSEDDEAFSKEGVGVGLGAGKPKARQVPAPTATTMKPRTRSRSNSSSSKQTPCAKCVVKTHKPKKPFNPFPTTRRPRAKSAKFGLYS